MKTYQVAIHHSTTRAPLTTITVEARDYEHAMAQMILCHDEYIYQVDEVVLPTFAPPTGLMDDACTRCGRRDGHLFPNAYGREWTCLACTGTLGPHGETVLLGNRVDATRESPAPHWRVTVQGRPRKGAAYGDYVYEVEGRTEAEAIEAAKSAFARAYPKGGWPTLERITQI